MCHAQNYCAETFCPGHKAHLHQKPRNASQLYSKICCHILGFKSENSIMASSMEVKTCPTNGKDTDLKLMLHWL